MKMEKAAAEAEFERWMESMGLDQDEKEMPEEHLDGFLKTKHRIVTAIQRGHLEITEDGEAQYTPQREASQYKEPLTFHERTGAHMIGSGSRKNNDPMKQTYAVIAGMCKVQTKNISGLAGMDLKICEAIYLLLMD